MFSFVFNDYQNQITDFGPCLVEKKGKLEEEDYGQARRPLLTKPWRQRSYTIISLGLAPPRQTFNEIAINVIQQRRQLFLPELRFVATVTTSGPVKFLPNV